MLKMLRIRMRSLQLITTLSSAVCFTACSASSLDENEALTVH
jgi:hypothetical protein